MVYYTWGQAEWLKLWQITWKMGGKSETEFEIEDDIAFKLTGGM